MKVLKERLLLNDLKSTLDVVEQPTMIIRNEKEPIILLTLEEYNKMKEEMYKNKQLG